ncbi:MAG: bifunctional pyr operon transcriptional regulator/uracil phosphoribosyltransferase PyrR [Clostridiales bacterium]|jgi:pyrimidine operon attenuation protein/uracil phosphoribosyltransferase|nr:bifunctional pyr operon transcriptional regulator/uracil phosphoribosyltransferase PyrR [Clostridiales bacterium]
MRFKANVMDAAQMRRALIRMGHRIVEHNRASPAVALVGIQRRGLTLARELAAVIRDLDGFDIPVGAVDVTLYRDDLALVAELPALKNTDLPFPVTDADIILVDDVLYTGRTVKAAMEVLWSLGRPKTVQLAVLIDRGRRELPIGANFVGKTVPSERDELISVSVKEIDGVNSVDLYSLN